MCLKAHDGSCNRRVAAAFEAPTRLLRAYQAGVRLCILSDRPKPPLYLTLSHCWGQIDILKLKRNNANDFLQNMDGMSPSDYFFSPDKSEKVESLFHRSIGVSPLCLADNEQDQVHGMR
jgi:hypothetical protein